MTFLEKWHIHKRSPLSVLFRFPQSTFKTDVILDEASIEVAFHGLNAREADFF